MKYVFEFDSVTKQVVATCDGAPVADLRSVCLERSWTNREGQPDPDFTLRVCQMRYDPGSGVLTEMNTCASADGTLVERPTQADMAAAFGKALAKYTGG
jgi:hypothetical protein